jgi:hypothetical protein
MSTPLPSPSRQQLHARSLRPWLGWALPRPVPPTLRRAAGRPAHVLVAARLDREPGPPRGEPSSAAEAAAAAPAAAAAAGDLADLFPSDSGADSGDEEEGDSRIKLEQFEAVASSVLESRRLKRALTTGEPPKGAYCSLPVCASVLDGTCMSNSWDLSGYPSVLRWVLATLFWVYMRGARGGACSKRVHGCREGHNGAAGNAGGWSAGQGMGGLKFRFGRREVALLHLQLLQLLWIGQHGAVLGGAHEGEGNPLAGLRGSLPGGVPHPPLLLILSQLRLPCYPAWSALQHGRNNSTAEQAARKPLATGSRSIGRQPS